MEAKDSVSQQTRSKRAIGRPRKSSESSSTPKNANGSNGRTPESPELTKLRNLLQSQSNNVVKKFKLQETNARLELEKEREQSVLQLMENANEIEHIKQSCVRSLIQRRCNVQEDTNVRTRFTRLTKNMRNWSKKYAKYKFVFDHKSRADITVALTAQPCPSTSHTEVKMLLERGLSAAIALNSMLSKHVFTIFVKQPFFFLQNVDGGGAKGGLADAITKMFEIGQQVDANFANVWRSYTMTLLHPQKADNSGTLLGEDPTITQMKGNQYQRYTSSFLDLKIVRLLLDDVELTGMKTRHSELLSIVSETGDFLLLLATQKVRTEALFFDSLPKAFIRGRSELMRLHPSAENTNDQELVKGEVVSLVVAPAIVAYGDEDGTNYDKRKVWSEAVIITSPLNPITPLYKRTQDYQPTEIIHIESEEASPHDEGKPIDAVIPQRSCQMPGTSFYVQDLTQVESSGKAYVGDKESENAWEESNVESRTSRCTTRVLNDLNAAPDQNKQISPYREDLDAFKTSEMTEAYNQAIGTSDTLIGTEGPNSKINPLFRASQNLIVVIPITSVTTRNHTKSPKDGQKRPSEAILEAETSKKNKLEDSTSSITSFALPEQNGPPSDLVVKLE